MLKPSHVIVKVPAVISRGGEHFLTEISRPSSASVFRNRRYSYDFNGSL